MSELPPSPVGAYPRPTFTGPSSPEDADKIEALANGYWGLNWVFLITVVMVVPLNIAFRLVASPLLLVAIPVVGIVVGFLTYPRNKEIAFGKGWSPTGGVIASVLMGLNVAICCGIIGFIVMQQIAMSGMRKLGVPQKVMRKKAWVMEYAAGLRGQSPLYVPPSPPT
jgi:hypothetical protein